MHIALTKIAIMHGTSVRLIHWYGFSSNLHLCLYDEADVLFHDPVTYFLIPFVVVLLPGFVPFLLCFLPRFEEDGVDLKENKADRHKSRTRNSISHCVCLKMHKRKSVTDGRARMERRMDRPNDL